MIWLLASCAGTDVGTVDGVPTDTAQTELTVAIEATDAPLARRLVVQAGAPVTLDVSWTDGEHEVTVAFDDATEAHAHTLLGFRAGRTYDVVIEATTAAGDVLSAAETVMTDPLPAHFPVAELTVPRPADVEPGHTLVSLRVPQPIGASDTELVAVYDEEGHVVWWRALADLSQDVREVDGELVILAGSLEPRISRIAWDGSEITWWKLEDAQPPGVVVDAPSGGNFHHDVVYVPPDRYVALGRYPEMVQDWPRSYSDPQDRGARTIASDTVVEYAPDGSVLRETRLIDLLPVDRIGYDSLETTVEGWADWAHANAVVPDGDQIVVSLRHQDAIVAFDPAAGQVNWILGHPDNWPPELQGALLRPVGTMRWPWHTHAPMFGPDGPGGERRLAVFDNGNHRAAPFTGVDPVTDPSLLASRVVAFEIDEVAGTVTELWSFEQSTVAGGRLFCEAVGDADWLPGGTVLSTWGFLDRLPGGQTNASAGLGTRSIRLVELDPDTLSDVWHLHLSTPASANPAGWTAYRADRIPSLYGRVVD